jgi:aminopeptidase N
MKSWFIVLFLGCTTFLYSQSIGTPSGMRGSNFCHQKKIHSNNLAMEMKANLPHSYDVLHYALNLNIYSCFLSPYSKLYSAWEIITLQADSSISGITLNAANGSLQIDSVGLNGVSFVHSGDILKVLLDRTYAPGDTIRVKISYLHKNVNDGAVYTNSGFFFTDCEPEGARKWFPCWDKPSDKATMELTAKTPGSVKLGSNGRLADSTKNGDTISYHWVSRDPIATYLMVISAKVNYNLDIVYWKNPQTLENIPFRFYYNSGESPAAMETKVLAMASHYSDLFCVHPFEKNGFATLNGQFGWGGMENQTLTSLCPNCWGEDLISHEFAHQWFGDMITCATWADVFLNEGMATYCEALWAEFSSGKSLYNDYITGNANEYLQSGHSWPIYNPSWVTNTPDINTLFDTPITYDKGACVLHMLRYTLGDTLFFKGLKAYANDPELRFRSATIVDFKNDMSTAAGQDLTWFFEPWFNQPLHPVYANNYFIDSVDSKIWLAGFIASQTQTNTVFHPMPLELTISFAQGADTTVRVFNAVNNQEFTFRFNRQPVSLTFDPNNNIVLKSASLSTILPGPVPTSPDNGMSGLQLNPILSWTTIMDATSYQVQVASDSLFTHVLFSDSTITGTATQLSSLSNGKVYYWRVRALVQDQYTAYSEAWQFNTGTTGNIEVRNSLAFSLEQNYPNPFNPTTTIRFTTSAASKTTLTIYNQLGQLVTELVNAELPAGIHEITWNATTSPSGVYFYKLISGKNVAVKKLLLMK